jgi:hypothetical protein
MSKNMRIPIGLIAALLALPAAAFADCDAFEIPGGPEASGPTLVVVGTTAKQTLILNVSAASATVNLDCNGNNSFSDPGDLNGVAFGGDIRVFDIRLGGNDVVTYNIAGDLNGNSKSAQIILGPGTNTVNVTSTATLIQGNSRVLVDIAGSSGADTVTGSIPTTIDASAFLLRVDLGAGNDKVAVAFTNSVIQNGSIVGVEALLGLGANTFQWTKTGPLVASTMSIDVEGGAGPDTVTTFLGSALSAGARYFVNADLGGGNDVFNGLLDFNTFSLTGSSEAHFRALGGLGNDILSVTRNGTVGNVLHQGGIFDVDLVGGAGNDSLTVDVAGNSYNPSANALLRLRADGGVGTDVLAVRVDAQAASVPVFDASVTGGAGNDNVSVTLNDNGANTTANYKPAGAVLVDGGTGIDVCPLSGNGLLHKRNCES